MMRYWILLAAAIVLEVAGTTSMKLSQGFAKPLFSALLFAFYGSSLVALTFALKKIDVGVAYAVWSGLGTALIAVAGVLCFREPVTTQKVCSVVLIIAGVAGLYLGETAH